MLFTGDRRGRNRVVVGFTTIHAISAYHHWCCETHQGEVYNIIWSSLSVTCDRPVVFSWSSGFLHQ